MGKTDQNPEPSSSDSEATPAHSADAARSPSPHSSSVLLERYRIALRCAGLGLWSLEVPSNALDVDGEGREILALPDGVGLDLEAWLEHVDHEDRPRFREGLQRALHGPGDGAFSEEYRTAASERSDRQTRWIHACGRALYDSVPESNARLVVGTVCDITTRKRAELDREELIQELARTVRSSEMLVGILGHDLRNPLSAIVAAAQLALRRGEGAALKDPLSRIVVSAMRMARMIDQLLDFTSARLGGGIPLGLRPMDLNDLARDAVDEFRVAHPERSIVLQATGDAKGTWDSDRLAQVLSNLLGNAMLHGSAGGAVVVRVEGEMSDAVVLRVSNQGAIPADLQGVIFNPFRGSSRDRTRGLGLGLYVTRQIVLAHGGDIDVTSSEANGTTFSVHLARVTDATRASDVADERDEEIAALHKLAAPSGATSVTGQLFGVVPLHEREPAAYWKLVDRYVALLEQALSKHAYRDSSPDVAVELRAIADQLGGLRAGAREVAELHARALRRKTQSMSAARVQTLIAEGRLVSFELMGHLVSFYRRHAVPGAGRRGKP